MIEISKDEIIDIISEYCIDWKNCDELAGKLLSFFNDKVKEIDTHADWEKKLDELHEILEARNIKTKK
jgi:hypothetical protein